MQDIVHVLIIIASGYSHSPLVTTHEFSSERACKVALSNITTQGLLLKMNGRMGMVCVPR